MSGKKDKAAILTTLFLFIFFSTAVQGVAAYTSTITPSFYTIITHIDKYPYSPYTQVPVDFANTTSGYYIHIGPAVRSSQDPEPGVYAQVDASTLFSWSYGRPVSYYTWTTGGGWSWDWYEIYISGTIIDPTFSATSGTVVSGGTSGSFTVTETGFKVFEGMITTPPAPAEADAKFHTDWTPTVTLHWTQLDISASPVNAYKGQQVSFAATVKDGAQPYSFRWNFGDGTPISALQNPTHAFSATGIYNVTCTATDSVGISDTKWLLVNVATLYLTVQAGAGGTTDPAPGTYPVGLGSSVSVTALPNSGYALYRWQLDGTDSGSSNPFTVYFTTYANHTLKVLFAPKLTVTASANVTSGTAPLPVQFTCTALGGLPPYAYSWDFGDRGTSDQQNPIHTYAQPGGYTATVTVTDKEGSIGRAYVSITVASPFDFTISRKNDISVVAGQSGTSTIYVNSSQGQAQPVSLSLQWIGTAPAGASASLSTQSVVPNGTSLLTFVAGANTPIGTYTCRVIGTAGALTRYVDVYITVSQQLYYLTVQAGTGGTTSPSPGVYAYPAGASASVSAAPSANFDRWQLDGVDCSTNNPVTVVMNANHTLTALFTQPSYTLTVQAGTGGTTNPAPGTYTYTAGSTAQVSAQPSQGYTFSKWQLDGVDAGSNNPITVTMNANHILTASFAQNPSYPPSSLTFDVRYYDNNRWNQGYFASYGIVRYSGAASGTAFDSPTTITVNVQGSGDVYAYFDPRNTQGGLVSVWGGTPKAKVYSASYYIDESLYDTVAPSSITYPSSYDMLVVSGHTHVLSMNVKWMDYPVNVSANAQWGYAVVTSNSPGWSLYQEQYLNYTNGFGVYNVDYSSFVRVKAFPYVGYYFDRIVVDDTTYYDDTVLIENVVGPHNVTVYFSAVPPTFKLTVQAGAGGTTIPSPGVYNVPRYSYQSVVAYVTTSGYYFSNWLVDTTVDRTGAGTNSSSVSVYVDKDRTVTAAFDTDYPVPVRPSYPRDGTQLSRIVVYENAGVNVTVTVPGITSPTNVTVTAWLDGVRWWDWSSLSNRETVYKFTGTATTNASGYLSVAFGSEVDRTTTCYSANPSDPLGTQHLAHAEVKVGSNTYTYENSWKVDNVMATAEFDYNLTGINATFRFVYSTDGVPAKGRNGLYVTGLSTGHPYTPEAYDIWNGTSIMWDRFSTPCDGNAISHLWVPYSWLNNSTLRSTVSMPIYYDFSPYGIQKPVVAAFAVKNNVTYTVMTPQLFFINYTCAVAEPFDWGDRVNLAPIEGAYAYLYWDTYAYPFNESGGLLGVFGPSAAIPLYREGGGGRVYINATAVNSSLSPIPAGAGLVIPVDRTQVKGIVLTFPDVAQTMGWPNLHGPKRLWLQLVPGHSSGVLYNPVRDGRILLAGWLG